MNLSSGKFAQRVLKTKLEQTTYADTYVDGCSGWCKTRYFYAPRHKVECI